MLERLSPGDVVRDAEIGGMYAVRGPRRVSVKIAVDLARGKTVRRTLAQWAPGGVTMLDLQNVRREAARLREEIRAGNVPEPKARRAPQPDVPAGTLTVGAAIDRYVDDMTRRGCAERSVKLTGERLRKHLASWLAKPIASVGKSDCQVEHDRLTASSGPVQANRVLRDFRAVWNLAAKQTDALDSMPACPVRAVTMHLETRRRDGVVITDLRDWWRRTGELPNRLRCLMFRLGLLSGLRPGNLCGIRREWIQLDVERPRIGFPADVMKGKSGKRRPFTLALSAPMVDLVQQALELGPKAVGVAPARCEWLFPTRSRDGRSIVATSNWTEPTLGSNECGHALRHTYRTLATAAGAPYDVAELLVGHVLPGVGARYVHPAELATLWEWQAKISRHILGRVGACAETAG